MKNYTTRFTACLGMLAGSWAIATAAHAQIPVTGGQATGDAAFFVPGTTSPSGSPILFDTAIKTLRIVTPNGTSTTSRFIPSAADFTDVNGNSLPDSGDTGRLAGTLSGVAFSSNGSPVFFQGIPTNFSFTLNTFNPAFLQGGTLISPAEEGAAPLIFLPIAPITLSPQSSTSFTTDQGQLQVGPFSATLTGDSIGLPSNLQFRASSDVAIVPVELGRRIKFDFEGQNVIPSFADFDGDTLEFEGPTTQFKVQSVGTPGTREFKIEGSIANLAIQITSPFDVKENSLDLAIATGPLKYSIKGEGPGYVAFGNSSVSFTGTARKDTEFKFEQGNQKFEGKSIGNVAFNLITGINGTVNFVPFVGVNNNGTEFNVIQTQTLINNTTIISTSTTTTSVAFTNVVLNPSTTYIRLFNPSLLVVDRDDDDDDNNDDIVYGNLTYTIYQGSLPAVVVVERDDDGRIIFVERERGRGRALGRRRRVIAAYQEVGLPSRVFPGLVGLRQLPPEEINTTGDDDDSTPPPGTTTIPGTTTPGTTPPGTTTSPGTTTP